MHRKYGKVRNLTKGIFINAVGSIPSRTSIVASCVTRRCPSVGCRPRPSSTMISPPNPTSTLSASLVGKSTLRAPCPSRTPKTNNCWPRFKKGKWDWPFPIPSRNRWPPSWKNVGTRRREAGLHSPTSSQPWGICWPNPKCNLPFPPPNTLNTPTQHLAIREWWIIGCMMEGKPGYNWKLLWWKENSISLVGFRMNCTYFLCDASKRKKVHLSCPGGGKLTTC